MKKIQFALSMMLPAMALSAALSVASHPMLAQSAPDSSRNATAQQQPMQPDDQNAVSVKTFSGRIVKSGDKLVLKDMTNKTTYQLDDQQKAQDFRNKSVRVTGVLDASTGTIRVSTIEPA
jgi:methionine-rich copper-binding protein CopC